MSTEQPRVIIGEKEGFLMTTFQPPIHENKFMEATTNAFTIEEIVRDRNNNRRIWGIMYSIGDRANLKQNLTKLRTDVEANTSYRVANEVIKIGTVATEATLSPSS